MSVDWAEYGLNGRVIPAGKYEIVVSARDNSGRLLRVSKFPVTIEH